MDIKELEGKIFYALNDFFEAESFALLIDRKQFRKITPTGFVNVICILIEYNNQSDTWAEVHIGVRNNQVEQIAQQFLNINLTDYKEDVNTLVISIGKYNNDKYFRYKIIDEDDLENVCLSVKDFMTTEGFYFLDKSQDLQHIDRLLNSNYTKPSKYVYNQVHRCFKGLITAKLTTNPRYQQIKDSYLRYVKRNGTPPEQDNFDRLMAYLHYYNPN